MHKAVQCATGKPWAGFTNMCSLFSLSVIVILHLATWFSGLCPRAYLSLKILGRATLWISMSSLDVAGIW